MPASSTPHPTRREGWRARAMQGSREFVLRLEGILPTGLCLSFGFLFFGSKT